MSLIDTTFTAFSEFTTTTAVDPALNYCGFQGDFTYDSAVVGFDPPFVQAAGLTRHGWVIAAPPPIPPFQARLGRVHVTGAGPTPLPALRGSGQLFEMFMVRVSSVTGASTSLIWDQGATHFRFRTCAPNFGEYAPVQKNGAITINLTETLPVKTISTTVPVATNLTAPVVTTNMNPFHYFVGFQGDFVYNSNIIQFQTPFVLPAGLTATNWNVSANILNGTGPTARILRISAFSLDFTPLNGCGVLFNLQFRRVSTTNNATTALTWQPTPDNFFFISADLTTHDPFSTPPGSITITTSANPTPTPPIPVCTPKPNPQSTPVLDHFKAYVTTGAPPQDVNPPGNAQVLLEDQFNEGNPVPKTVGAPVRFALPVQKTHGNVITPITNPDAHLEMFLILPTEAGTTRLVDVANQFGLQTLTVQDPVFLGVPTRKLPFAAPPVDVDGNPFLDHFEFYNATGASCGFRCEPGRPVPSGAGRSGASTPLLRQPGGEDPQRCDHAHRASDRLPGLLRHRAAALQFYRPDAQSV